MVVTIRHMFCSKLAIPFKIPTCTLYIFHTQQLKVGNVAYYVIWRQLNIIREVWLFYGLRSCKTYHKYKLYIRRFQDFQHYIQGDAEIFKDILKWIMNEKVRFINR